jgi:hypothetical protein
MISEQDIEKERQEINQKYQDYFNVSDRITISLDSNNETVSLTIKNISLYDVDEIINQALWRACF